MIFRFSAFGGWGWREKPRESVDSTCPLRPPKVSSPEEATQKLEQAIKKKEARPRTDG